MLKQALIFCTCFSALQLGCATSAQSQVEPEHTGPLQTVWQLGVPDGQSDEFAGKVESYRGYINRLGDYDKLFVVGSDDPADSWTWVLPGPVDRWAGNASGSWRVNFAALGFTLSGAPDRPCVLVLDFASVHPERPPLLRIEVNGHRHTFKVPSDFEPDTQQLRVPIAPGQLNSGSNVVRLYSIEGSWVEFDALSLEAPEGSTSLAEPRDIVVQDVYWSEREKNTDGTRVHALVVDTINRSEEPRVLTVWVDGKQVEEHSFPPGRQAWEIDLPTVGRSTGRTIQVRDAQGALVDRDLVQAPAELVRSSDYVNQLAGSTNSRWMIAPGPWMPMSLMRLAPDNEATRWKSGYDYMVESIAGFSHIHEWTMTGLLTMPTTGPLVTSAGPVNNPDAGWRSRIEPTQQTAEVGYYAVELIDTGINVELASTERAAMQRITYPATDAARLICALQTGVDEYGTIIEAAEVWIENDHEIRGWSKQVNAGSGYPERQDYIVHFVMQFDRPITALDVWAEGEIKTGQRRLSYVRSANSARGDCGFAPRFDMSEGGTLQTRTGISLVDVDGAADNLDTEITQPFGWEFDDVVEYQKTVWDQLLDRFELGTHDRTRRQRFYTCLYRSLCGRCSINDVDGRWRDAREDIQRTEPGQRLFSGDALWGTQWNLIPVWNWFYPSFSHAIVRTQRDHFDAIGWTLKGPAGGEAIGVMLGSSEILLAAGAWTAGVRPVEADKLWEAVYHQATTPGQHFETGGFVGNEHYADYLELGYIPNDARGYANYSSSTLEYAYQDWAVAQLAEMIGRPDDEKQMFLDRAENWQNAIHPDTGLVAFRTRDGAWTNQSRCAEGSASQYRWFVPHHPAQLLQRIGGEPMLDHLERELVASESMNFMAPGDHMAAIPVNHGNQPMMHVSWLFNLHGRPESTQRWVRSILDRYYGFTQYDAYLGDEDQGQMSAWLVLASIGLFSIDGGIGPDSMVELIPPSFEKITIAREHGPDWIIQAPSEVVATGRGRSVRVNGTLVADNRVPLATLLSGNQDIRIVWE